MAEKLTLKEKPKFPVEFGDETTLAVEARDTSGEKHVEISQDKTDEYSTEAQLIDDEDDKVEIVKDDGAKEEDDRLSRQDDEDMSSDDIKAEAKRLQNRLDRLDRKERRKKFKEKDKSTIRTLQNRISELEGRVSTTGAVNKIEVDYANVKANHDAWEAKQFEYAKAFKENFAAGDPDKTAEAMEKWEEAKHNVRAWKGALANVSAAREKAASGAPINAEKESFIADKSAEFRNENKWFDSRGGNLDSKLALTLAQSLIDDNFDPATDDYWDELQDLLEERLPHRYGKLTQSKKPEKETVVVDDDEEEPQPPPKKIIQKSPVATKANAETVNKGNKNTYKLSDTQRLVLRQAGHIEGTPEWLRAVEIYRQRDAAKK